jgi:hypothetical protein
MSFEPNAPAAAGAVITCRDDLVEALRQRKAQLNLSNEFVEEQLLMTAGGADKVLGPSQVKNLTLPVAFDMIELFGCKLMMMPCPETEARMSKRWVQRNGAQVHRTARVSRVILERAKPLVMSEHLNRKFGLKAANAARNAMLSREQRSKIARKAARTRWKMHRAAMKARTPGAAECSP